MNTTGYADVILAELKRTINLIDSEEAEKLVEGIFMCEKGVCCRWGTLWLHG